MRRPAKPVNIAKVLSGPVFVHRILWLKPTKTFKSAAGNVPMSRISAPRVLRSSFSLFCPNSFFKFFFTSPLRSKPRALLNSYFYTLVELSYSCAKARSSPSGGIRFQIRRANSTLREEWRKEGNPSLECEMDGAAMLGFNKRRADGRDRSDKPRALQLKSRKLNPVTTTCYVQILGTGMDTQDTSPSVFLFFDKQRFIFNAGEGLQRFCTEHKIKLSKVDHIFLTRVSSETAGGLPGLLLTLAGIGEAGMSVNIWGPSDLKYLVDAMQSFIPNAAMVHTHSFGEALSTVGDSGLDHVQACPVKPIVLIDDEVVRLSAIPLRPNYFGGSFMKPGDVAVVYTCELPEIKGKFDPEKAASLGLKPGPKFRELQLGNSVMSDHLDILVHSSDVLGPSLAGPIVLLVDCPTPSHTQGLFSSQSLESYYADSQDCQTEGINFVNCVIHLGPASVTKKADYQIWMKRFGNAHHIMAGHEMKNVEIPILKSSARISTRLNYLCPQLFPSSGFLSLKDEVNFSVKSSIVPCKEHSSDVNAGFSAENLLKYHLRPYSRLGFDQTATPSFLNHMQILNELLSEIPEIKEISERVSSLWRNHAENKGLKQPCTKETSHLDDNLEYQRDIASKEGIPCLNFNHKQELGDFADIPACLNNISREDMEIVLLGTGSSQPSKYRNVSSIFVNLFSKGGLLLDCGEGTLAQLKRRYGIEGADNVVRTLNLIWTSHIHADHHTGLARILSLRCQLLRDEPHEPLLVIGPKPLKRFLDAYSRLEDLDILFLDCRHMTTDVYDESEPKGAEPMLPGSLADKGTSMPAIWRLKELLQEAGLEALYSVPVIHCPQAFAVVLKAAERVNNAGKVIPGWKLVYSGDTRPCKALIDASRNATVLIHEATFEDSLREEAVARNHSTTEEAILVGSAAGAYRIILTHFSQRYPKIPVFDEAHMHNTCIGFDLMSVNLADLPLLPKMLPFLKLLFRNELATAGESDDDAIVDLAASQQ